MTPIRADKNDRVNTEIRVHPRHPRFSFYDGRSRPRGSALRVLAVLLAAAIVAGLEGAGVVAAEAPQLAVYAMNADGANLHKVAQAPGKRWHAAPSWSSDGKFIVFHAYSMDAATPDSHIFVV